MSEVRESTEVACLAEVSSAITLDYLSRWKAMNARALELSEVLGHRPPDPDGEAMTEAGATLLAAVLPRSELQIQRAVIDTLERRARGDEGSIGRSILRINVPGASGAEGDAWQLVVGAGAVLATIPDPEPGEELEHRVGRLETLIAGAGAVLRHIGAAMAWAPSAGERAGPPGAAAT